MSTVREKLCIAHLPTAQILLQYLLLVPIRMSYMHLVLGQQIPINIKETNKAWQGSRGIAIHSVHSSSRIFCKLAANNGSKLSCWHENLYGYEPMDSAALSSMHHQSPHKRKENKHLNRAQDSKRTHRRALDLVHIISLVHIVQVVHQRSMEKKFHARLSRTDHV